MASGRTASSIAMVALLASVTPGCGGGDTASTTSSAAESSPTTSAPVEPTTPPDTTDVTTTAPTTAAPTTAVPTEDAPSDRPRTVDDIFAMDRPVVLAHTGGEDAYPGSTMFAFAESVDDGVDILDLNVVLSADGVLMVQHDETVDRTTNGTGAVADMTVAELQALDDAYWFTPDCGVCSDQPDEAYIYRGVRTGEVPPPDGYTPDDFAMPTFRQLVERFPDLPLNIEIKGGGDPARAAADVLATDLVDLDRVDASIVTSFDDEIVTYFHGLAPDVELSPGLGATTAWVLEATPLPDGMRILQLPPDYEGVTVITPELIEAADTVGYPIWVWPNNRNLENEASYASYLEMGIVGLNINFPAQGVAAVESFTADESG